MDSTSTLPKREPSRRGVASTMRLVRKFASTNTSLIIFALFLAVMMWGFVAYQKRGETTEFKATTPVVLKDIPENLEVVASNVGTVSVLVRVRRAIARSINPNQFQVALDLRNQLPGSFDYEITDKDISYNNVVGHKDIDILQISPSRVPLTLEETIKKNVPIRPRYFGNLAAGVAIKSIVISPARVMISGPQTYVQSLVSVSTRPLDVEGLKNDVEMKASLDLPPQLRLVNPEATFFKATITVTSDAQRVLVREIHVRFVNSKFAYQASNDLINAHLEGPKEIMDSIDVSKVFAQIDLAKYSPGDYRGLSPLVILPEGVKVLEQWPIVDLFVLKRRVDK